ncbi:Calcium influx-promoting protein ehs1 [Golovinomyces cichoracearum]|uniref:Calcium influx-promoting protein ehs1 n=1 Tax=Golovinomyces cichoracearum TaxID=62708 RepID=A0A420II54_9PEZI|nr:Calcium influx-promoting protein ehs1 [Golovinomyces cichoracearum]
MGKGIRDEKRKRQLPKPMDLANNVMVPIKLERGQLFSFKFSNESLWARKSLNISPFPSPINLPKTKLKSILSPMMDNNGKGLDDNSKLIYHQVNDVPNGKNTYHSLDQRFQNKAKEKTSSRETSPAMKAPESNQRTLYISVTTCLQPKPVTKSITKPPPQLQLYISQSQLNQFPSLAQDDNSSQDLVELVEGYALHIIEATGDVYLGVYASNDLNYTGIYSAQVAASIDAPYHYHEDNSDPNLFVADSDSDSVLLYTDPFIQNGSNSTLLQEWVNASPPFVMFASDMQNAENIVGLRSSYCGLEQKMNISAPGISKAVFKSKVTTSITSLGPTKLPRQQFYMDGLTPSTTYIAALAMPFHGSKDNLVGGGGRVFQQIKFSTLEAGNCDLIYDLSFCDQVAYNVPSNPQKFPNTSLLANFYDNSTRAIYQNFEKVLAQIPCEITASGQYSLARTCSDCARAYKEWLCAVNIPRCTDISSPMTWLYPRAIEQAFPNGSFFDYSLMNHGDLASMRFSRNTDIDQLVGPGPYKEVLPCKELCHNLVSSCPASLGFDCPKPGQIGFDASYGQMPIGHTDDQGRRMNITCNFPGTVYFAGGDHQAKTIQMKIIIILSLMVFALT